MTTSTETTVMLERVIALLVDVTDGAITPDSCDTGPGSVTRLGVSSLAMLEFLVAIEDEFGIEWDDDVAPSVFDSFDAIVAYISEQIRQ